MSYRSLISLMPKTSVDADAQAVINAIEGTGVTLSSIEKSACNTLITDFKNYGLWTKCKAIYGFLGGTAAAHKFNWKDPQDLDAAYRLQFNGGWTHSSNGALPNGTNAYANTYLIPSSILLLNSTHISFYSRTNGATPGFEMGAADAASANGLLMSIQSTFFSGNMFSDNYNIARVSGSHAGGMGYFISNRQSSTSLKIIRNTSVINSISINGTSRTSSALFISAYNLNGIAAQYSNKQCAFASIGDGLTDTEAANLYTAVQAFETSLNRQV